MELQIGDSNPKGLKVIKQTTSEKNRRASAEVRRNSFQKKLMADSN